ncbi:MAG: ABC transporter permease [Oscillospiraceae bacterium]|nr:ABC transporter permease [Oscillospiraceae bacterium]
MEKNKTFGSIGAKLGDLGSSLFSIALALAMGAVIILFMGLNPLTAYAELWRGAFQNPTAIANTLSRATPLLLCGLSVAVARRAGLFNIGAEGQLHAGAIATILFMLAFPSLPRILLLPVGILIGMFAGAAWALIPGILKAKRGIHEVVVCIMCNYLIILFCAYLVNGPFLEPGSHVGQTTLIAEAGRLSNLFVPRSQLNTGFLIAIGVAVVVYIFLFKTSLGFKFRTVGSNPEAARAGGIIPEKISIGAMAFAGSIAALAGITEVLGKYYRFIDGFSPSFGFTGIAVAFLARSNPFGIILSALLFGTLDSGSLRMARVTGVSSDLIIVIQALVIFFVAIPNITKFFKLPKNVILARFDK